MFSLVYISSAVIPFSTEQLQQLLAKCRAKNAALGVTGLLLYKDGNFMQLLEGEEQTVLALRDHIQSDPRHCGMVTLLQESAAGRQFDSWSMGFRDLSPPLDEPVEGFSEIMNYDFTGREFQEHPSLAQKLLLSLKKNL